MSDEATAPKVKRVAPYPIVGAVENDGKPTKMAIIFLSARGFVAKTPGLMLKVGAVHRVSFEIPVLRHFVRTEAKIFKTYDRAADQSVSAVERAAEFLFLSADAVDQKQIQRFVNAIGQKTA